MSSAHDGQPAVRPILLWLVALFSALFIATLLLFAGECPSADLCAPITAADQSQTRIDTALPAPRGDFIVEQSFTTDHDGLSSIELIIVHYGGEQREGQLTLELRDDQDDVVASQTLPSGDLAHNQVYNFEFPAQVGSSGRAYRLRLIGDAQNHASVWGYSLDVVERGELQLRPQSDGLPVPETAARELRFVSRYTLTFAESVAYLARTAQQYAGLFVLMLAFLLMPGCLFLLATGRRAWDPAAWIGTALALGVASWPVAWLWLSLTGIRWSTALLWAVLIAGWAAVAAMMAWRWRRERRGGRQRLRTRVDWRVLGLLLLLLAASVTVRLLAVRDLAFPAWVDSSRHGLITAVMVAQGQAPSDYSPYLPVERFPYHYGIHAIAASLSLVTGEPLPGLLLMLGQFMNGLLPLTVYTAGWMVSRRAGIGLLAAFLVALPFLFPGYYATWGRLTQLSAMFVLPVLLGLTWRMGRGWPGTWSLAAVLGSGVFLLHFRVFLFFIPFALLVLLTQLVGYRRFRPYLLAAGLGAGLILPRAIQLWRDTDPVQAFQNSVAGFNDFPIGYLTSGWERLFIGLAAAGLVVVAIGVVKGSRWALLPLVLVVWVASLFFLLAGQRLGLPETLVVNLNSMYISLFLPLSLFLALVGARLLQWGARLVRGQRQADMIRLGAAVVLGLALGVLTIFGLRAQINIINPQTILAEAEDQRALDWMAGNLPEEALIATNSWRWLGSTWAAGDGGAWIVPLTGRDATTPPIDHIYDADLFAQVRAFNEYASGVPDWSDAAAVSWLREQGVTHIFVGARGGFFDPAALLRNPLIWPIYQRGPTFILEILPE